MPRHPIAKEKVAGSIPVSRSFLFSAYKPKNEAPTIRRSSFLYPVAKEFAKNDLKNGLLSIFSDLFSVSLQQLRVHCFSQVGIVVLHRRDAISHHFRYQFALHTVHQ